jgi:hypothetical protein
MASDDTPKSGKGSDAARLFAESAVAPSRRRRPDRRERCPAELGLRPSRRLRVQHAAVGSALGVRHGGEVKAGAGSRHPAYTTNRPPFGLPDAVAAKLSTEPRTLSVSNQLTIVAVGPGIGLTPW